MVARMRDRPDIQRLVGDLIRPGLVASVDLAADPPACTVAVGDLVTGPLPFLALRAGRVRIWSPPSVGEQCLLLCAEGDSNAGFVLPALYCDAFPPPAASADVVSVAFADGSTLSYDMAAHHLAVALSGGSASLAAPGGLTIEGDVTVTGKIAASQDVTAAGISLKSHPHDKVQPGSGQSAGPLA